MKMTEATPQKANESDVPFVLDLMAKHSKALGFLPRAAVVEFVRRGWVDIARENTEQAGYFAVRQHIAYQPALASITQAAVAMDAMRRHHGLALLETVAAEHALAGKQCLQACCAEDLESNAFWRAAGFIAIGVMTPDTSTKREIIVWRKPLSARIPIWFADMPERSGHRGRPTRSKRSPSKDYTHIIERVMSRR